MPALRAMPGIHSVQLLYNRSDPAMKGICVLVKVWDNLFTKVVPSSAERGARVVERRDFHSVCERLPRRPTSAQIFPGILPQRRIRYILSG